MRGVLRWRKMTWLILVFSALMFLWMVAGGSAADSVSSSEIQQCVGDGSVLTYQECKDSLQAGADVGTGIGVAFIFVLWFFGFVILSIIWFMTRPRGRSCPVCGENVRRGATVCKSCGLDFARTYATEPAQ